MWKAAHTGLVDIVELLLQKPGAAESIETPDSELQRTPLHAAAYSGQKSMVGLLLDHGAKLHSKDVAGNTPMMLCTQGWFATNSSKHEDTILTLLDEDSEVATTYPHLLHVAAMNGSEKVLNRLLDLGADPNKRDVHGWTAAQLAEQYENSHIVELLTNRKFAAARFHPTCWIETKSKYARVRRNGQMLEHLSPGKKFFAVIYLNIANTFSEKEVEGTSLQNDLVSFVSNHPAPPSTGTYYYEIEILPIKQKKLDK
jgi:ankyrin repeat protein